MAVDTDAGSAGGDKRCDLSGSLILTATIVPYRPGQREVAPVTSIFRYRTCMIRICVQSAVLLCRLFLPNCGVAEIFRI